MYYNKNVINNENLYPLAFGKQKVAAINVLKMLFLSFVTSVMRTVSRTAVRQRVTNCLNAVLKTDVMDKMSDLGSALGAGSFSQFELEDREEREEKMRKGRFRLGVLTLFRGLQEKTTSHGLPHVHHARGFQLYPLLC